MNTVRLPQKWVSGMLVALITTFLPTQISFSQVTLLSITPAHGSEHVSTEVSLILTFSQPLDTTSEYESYGGVPVGLQIRPDPGDPESTEISSDGLRLTVRFGAGANTTYRILVSGAKGRSGESLDRPYVSTFSTGSLPTMHVSGTIDFGGYNPRGTTVMLVSPRFFSGFIRDPEGGDDEGGVAYEAVAVALGTDGAYTIDFVGEGEYLVAGIKDVDDDGVPTVGTPGDGIGFFDVGSDSLPDPITVGLGVSVDSIDLMLSAPFSYTGLVQHDKAARMAGEAHSDADLTSIGGRDLTPWGEGFVWVYGFISPADEDTFGVVTLFQYLYPVDGTVQPPIPGFDPAVPAHPSVDTDVALASADAGGGANFRADHPETKVETVMFNVDLPTFLGSVPTGLTDRVPVWMVVYYADEEVEPLSILIDAQSGNILYAPGITTTARAAATRVEQLAMLWQVDAILVMVESPTELDPGGGSRFWRYYYYSAFAQIVRTFTTCTGIVVAIDDVEPSSVSSLGSLGGWIDSGAAMATADGSTGFREAHPDAVVTAQLSRGVSIGMPELNVWEFTYSSASSGTTTRVYVDGVTGGVITSVDSDPWQPPTEAVGYPNPFRSSTLVSFESRDTPCVQATIFNQLGQPIRTFSIPRPVFGTNYLRWDGTDDLERPVPAGAYFLAIADRDRTTVIKLVRLR